MMDKACSYLTVYMNSQNTCHWYIEKPVCRAPSVKVWWEAINTGTGSTGNTIPNITAKVKCTLVQALRLCTGRMAHRGSRGLTILFHDHGTRRGWGVSITPRPLFTPRKDLVPIVQEAGWAPGLVWTGVEILAPTGIRSLDQPARSQSLYLLCYPAHNSRYKRWYKQPPTM